MIFSMAPIPLARRLAMTAAANQIGMAPGAKWIACRNMDEGNGTPARYIECMEFFLAPYPLNCTPNEGDPAKAPDITINSWGCPTSEGCTTGTNCESRLRPRKLPVFRW